MAAKDVPHPSSKIDHFQHLKGPSGDSEVVAKSAVGEKLLFFKGQNLELIASPADLCALRETFHILD